MSKPIPKRLHAEFIWFMSAFDHDDFSDGAWFACLEEGAEAFMQNYKIKGCSNDAVHQYLDSAAAKKGEE